MYGHKDCTISNNKNVLNGWSTISLSMNREGQVKILTK